MQSTSITTTRTMSHVLVMSAASLCIAVLVGFSALVRFPIPGSPVPITLQTFALIAGAGFLKRGYALQMVAWYLLLGMVGAPFFAGGSGFSYAFGATGGYLIGFVAAAAIIGYAAPRAQSAWTKIALYLAAAAAIYVPGLVQLKLVTNASWTAALAMGVIPFIWFDLIKAGAAFATVRASSKIRSALDRLA